MSLLKLYGSILKYAGLEPDSSGYINFTIDDRKEPALIEGLRLVMPTNEQLKTFNPQEKIVFHPMTENILKGESVIIQKMKHTINIKLNYTIGVLALELLKIVSSPELHSKLSPEQAELLLVIKEADEKSVANFTDAMVSGIKVKPDRLFTNVFLKRGGVHNGKKYSRVGIVSFPFYEELKLGKLEKIRVKDRETYKQLMEFMFPDIGDTEQYNYGSSSSIAPFLDALMMASANVASRLNDICTIYKGIIDDVDSLIFESDWVEKFENLEDLAAEIRKIPVQRGNDGTIGVVEEAAPQAPSLPDAPVYPPQGGYPQYPQQQQPAVKPEVVQTKRGLDFHSVLAASPALQQAANLMMPALAQQQYMAPQMRREPSWASSQQQNYPQQPGYPSQQGYPQQGYPYQQGGYPQYPQQGYPQQGYPDGRRTPSWSNGI